MRGDSENYIQNILQGKKYMFEFIISLFNSLQNWRLVP